MSELMGGILAVVATIVFTIFIIWFVSYNEANAYRKYCDTPVTTWDAIFLDLRIDECKKCEDDK